MKYFSLNRQSPAVDFKEATIRGLAPDKGLYFPEHIPAVDKDMIRDIVNYADEEIAFKVIQPYVGDVLPAVELKEIVNQTVNFPIPLVDVEPGIFSLEMFHGNTLAFKDIGARFMSRCLGSFVKNNDKKITVLVATSGDTGGAVADGFYDVDGVDVVILYPSGKVSSVQEKQLTALGKNIHAIEVNGNFDQCQQMVKQAFSDHALNEQLFLTSANSINVARWLPQQFFYFLAYKQWKDKKNPPVISVPSGNFGNICAGLLAMKSGLPVKHFIAACNANDVIPAFMQSGQYKAQSTIPTISNAMDVGDPSNFVRILQLFDHQFEQLSEKLSAYSFDDDATRKAIQQVYSNQHYLLDPHGAVGYLALKKYLEDHPSDAGIFAETAHPVKFYDVVEPLIQTSIELPEPIQKLMQLEKQSTRMEVSFESLKDYLFSRA